MKTKQDCIRKIIDSPEWLYLIGSYHCCQCGHLTLKIKDLKIPSFFAEYPRREITILELKTRSIVEHSICMRCGEKVERLIPQAPRIQYKTLLQSWRRIALLALSFVFFALAIDENSPSLSHGYLVAAAITALLLKVCYLRYLHLWTRETGQNTHVKWRIASFLSGLALLFMLVLDFSINQDYVAMFFLMIVIIAMFSCWMLAGKLKRSRILWPSLAICLIGIANLVLSVQLEKE